MSKPETPSLTEQLRAANERLRAAEALLRERVTPSDGPPDPNSPFWMDRVRAFLEPKS